MIQPPIKVKEIILKHLVLVIIFFMKVNLVALEVPDPQELELLEHQLNMQQVNKTLPIITKLYPVVLPLLGMVKAKMPL